MGLIELYFIFALSTAIASWYLFYMPAMREAKERGGNSPTLNHPIFSSVTYIVIAAIMAPFTFPPILFTGAGERFKQGLLNSMLSED